jgi:hypothetical protein
MNISTNRLLAVIFVLFVVMLFALSKKRQSSIAPPDTKNTAPVAVEKPTPQVIQNIPSSPNAVSPAEFQSLVKKHRGEKEIGLQRMPLPREGNQAQLKVVLSIKPSCSPGDADAILLDLAKAPSHRLLATFEDLSESQKPMTWEVPQSLFKEGRAEKVFWVPVHPEPVQYGFFLCTANKSDNTCSDKKVQDINEIFTEHLTKKPNAGQQLRNIFFQYFLIDDRGLASFSQISKGDKVYDKLKKYADETKAPGKPNRAEIDVMKTTLKTVDSLPAVFSKDKLILQLPKFKESACRR